MGEQREELVFCCICADQFLAQRNVARLVFEEIKYALNGLVRTLQPEQVDIYKVRHARFVF